MMPEYEYPLDNEWKAARERLALLEAVFDPWTVRNFGKVGVAEGWHCLEVAGGAALSRNGSVAALESRVMSSQLTFSRIFLRRLPRRTWKSRTTTCCANRFPNKRSILSTHAQS